MERFVSPMPLPSDREREILTILIEECAEVQQRATKLLRFGRDEVQAGQELTNAARLSKELGDLEVLVAMAVDVGLVDVRIVRDRAARKRQKLARYMQTEAQS